MKRNRGDRVTAAVLLVCAALAAAFGAGAELPAVVGAAWEGFRLVFSWPNILYTAAATCLAMLFALSPGLSGSTLMALALSLTLSWEPLHVLLVFGAFVGGATFMGSVTAILFNIPGSGPSAATMIDGYPLAQKGQARTAIGSSATASALGSTFGVLALVLLIPLMRSAALSFGPPEFLMLTVWGLTTIAVLARGSVVKALIMAGFGFLLSCVGQDARTAEPRFTFGLLYLRDGLSLVPVVLGVFSVAEMIDLAASDRRTVSGLTRVGELTGSVREGARLVFTHFGLFLRSSFIGTVIGIIPGVGGTVAGFLAYAHAAQSAEDAREFGRGDIRGVIAPEAAHDAKDGGSLVPTLALGIPGNEGTALLLTALLLHGITPGKELMTTNLHLAFVLIWSLFVSNWLTSLLGIAVVSPLARLTLVRTQVLAPIIFVMAALGAFAYKERIEDVFLAFLFGAVGYYMKRYGWPRIPFVIALVLGRLFETNFQITLQLQELGRINFWARPLVLALLALTALNLALPIRQALRKRRGGA